MFGLLIFLAAILLFIWWGMRTKKEKPIEPSSHPELSVEGEGKIEPIIFLAKPIDAKPIATLDFTSQEPGGIKKISLYEGNSKEFDEITKAIENNEPIREDKRKLRKRDAKGRYIKKS